MKVLIVEDEYKIASVVKRGLEAEGFTVDVAYDGVEGFDLAATGEYDCIVLDLMLPKMGGIELCRNLRAEKIHTPVLILTAKGELSDKLKGFNVGADDYLTKPFSFEEMLARIRALARRRQIPFPQILEVDDLRLDTVNFEVLRKGKNIVLSRKEFSILEYLMRHKGRVVSKDEIINHVWNYTADVLPNTVEVFIKNLRQKIDKPFGSHLIKTVRGFGYKIVD